MASGLFPPAVPVAAHQICLLSNGKGNKNRDYMGIKGHRKPSKNPTFPRFLKLSQKHYQHNHIFLEKNGMELIKRLCIQRINVQFAMEVKNGWSQQDTLKSVAISSSFPR